MSGTIMLAVVDGDIPAASFPTVINRIWYSERQDEKPGRLIVRPTFLSHIDQAEDHDLSPGTFRHIKSGREYELNGLVYCLSPRHQLGVWYNALYVDQNGRGPHWFRPLRTNDGKGWLDDVDGQPRFVRLGATVCS